MESDSGREELQHTGNLGPNQHRETETRCRYTFFRLFRSGSIGAKSKFHTRSAEVRTVPGNPTPNHAGVSGRH